jgi:hypothetical protein
MSVIRSDDKYLSEAAYLLSEELKLKAETLKKEVGMGSIFIQNKIDSEKKLIEDLQKAAQGNSRNKTARLREIFDDVEAAHNAGTSFKTIVAVLAERGLVFNLATFVNVRNRIKKERAIAAAAAI